MSTVFVEVTDIPGDKTGVSTVSVVVTLRYR